MGPPRASRRKRCGAVAHAVAVGRRALGPGAKVPELRLGATGSMPLGSRARISGLRMLGQKGSEPKAAGPTPAR